MLKGSKRWLKGCVLPELSPPPPLSRPSPSLPLDRMIGITRSRLIFALHRFDIRTRLRRSP